MKQVAVFFRHPGAMDYPFGQKDYWEAYQDLDREIRKRGAEFYVVRSNRTYLGNGKFSKSWQFKRGKLIETGEIKVDKVYDKGKFQSDDKVSVFNRKYINEICTNKWKTYKLFSELCPVTYFVKNKRELLDALSRVPGNRKVVKPVTEAEGIGVYIGDTDYLVSQKHQFPLLAQEFLDTSEGIPGIYKGVHDLRIVLINGEVIYSFYRTPAKGKLLANVAQGGDFKVVPENILPEIALKVVKKVIDKFECDYCISVDTGFVSGVPRIIELNSMPGLFPASEGVRFEFFLKKLAGLLVK